MLSATFLETDAQVEGLEIGADGYLTQPVEAPVLAATIRALLRTRSARARGPRSRGPSGGSRSTRSPTPSPCSTRGRRRAARERRLRRDLSAGLVGRRGSAPQLGRRWRARASRSQLGTATFGVRIDVPGESPAARGRDAAATSPRGGPDRARRAWRERTISLTLQQRLLPERLPSDPRVALDAWFVAAEHELIVGGDWYDVIETADAVWLVIGDVAGHGVAAAAQAGQLRHSLRVYAHEGYTLPDAMARLNELVIATRLTGMATVCVAAIDRTADEVRMRQRRPPAAAAPARGRAAAARRGAPRDPPGVAGGLPRELACRSAPATGSSSTRTASSSVRARGSTTASRGWSTRRPASSTSRRCATGSSRGWSTSRTSATTSRCSSPSASERGAQAARAGAGGEPLARPVHPLARDPHLRDALLAGEREDRPECRLGRGAVAQHGRERPVGGRAQQHVVGAAAGGQVADLRAEPERARPRPSSRGRAGGPGR